MRSQEVFNMAETYEIAKLLQMIVVPGILILLLGYFIQHLSRRRRQPPGPWGVPVFGVYPLLGNAHYLTIDDWAKRYGSVMRLPFGSRDTVVISDLAILKDVLNREAFSNRGDSFFFKSLLNSQGMIGTNGTLWKTERRFALSTLRQMGMGKLKFEPVITHEADVLAEKFRETNGKAVDPQWWLLELTTNIITSLLFGEMPQQKDGVTPALYAKKLTDLLSREQRVEYLDTVFPFLKYIDSVLNVFGFKSILKEMDDSVKFIHRNIEEQISDFQPDRIRGYVDAYLVNFIDDTNSGEKHSENSHLVGTTRDLYMAGTDTISITLEWCLLYLIRYPEIQKAVHQEIDLHLGRDGKPSLKDKDSLVLTQATILEVSRFATLVPLGLGQVSDSDEVIEGYLIPKGTPVIANNWAIHHDSNIWSDPNRFDPYRFIDSDGKLLPNHKNLLTFLTGRRSCPGKSLADMELFLVMATLLQKFTFLAEDESCPPDMEAIVSLNLRPKPFRIRAVERNPTC